MPRVKNRMCRRTVALLRRRAGAILLLPGIVLILMGCSAAGQTLSVDGVVRDRTGAVLPDAEVLLKQTSGKSATRTDKEGRFRFSEVSRNGAMLSVHVPGFLPVQRAIVPDGKGSVSLDLSLQPSGSSEQVIVTASHSSRLPETAGSSVVVSASALVNSPSLRVDDLLRQVPGFSLLRRSSSRTANPTTQGVSMRGMGGSGASRALVLADAVPLGDPFGGWVYWNRVPKAAIESVEVVRGGGSNLYGSSALGGVIQLITRDPATPAITLEASYGNERTADLSFWTGSKWREWDYSIANEMFHTDGFVLVPGEDRGSVDTAANSEDLTLYATVGHTLGSRGRIFGRGNFFTESRNNGTREQVNDTRIGEGILGIDRQLGATGNLMLRVYGNAGSYHQTFSSIAPDRNSEAVVDRQHVPDQIVGGTVQWVHSLGENHTLITGLDLSNVLGTSDELLFSGPNLGRNSGGRQLRIGWFGEDIFHTGKWNIVLGARIDSWKNADGHVLTMPNIGQPTLMSYPDRSDVALSPRLSVLRRVSDHISLTGSVYRAFRAPTLNELYRTFRVGNVSTLNNASLTAERLTGAEAGVRLLGWNEKLSLRGTYFWSDIVDPITNVTLSSTPTLITRQRENLGKTRSRGIEIDGTFQLGPDLQTYAGYTFTHATVLEYPGNPGGVNLVGLDVPQVPRNLFTWGLFYSHSPHLFLSVSGRFVGEQFDDDQNQFPLRRFYTMDVEVGHTVKRHLEVFVAAENVLGQRYETARTPTVNLGPPALVRVGLRLNYPGRSQRSATMR
jgi:outer membrane receptor protein involved in Fe transport